MPIYTYRCDNCGVQFDRQQSFNDAPLTRCPECSKKALRKVFQPVGIVFKGSGFYATDHRSPSGTSRPGSAEKPAETKKDGEKTVPAETSSSQQQPIHKD
jgi:putative FmdB family regulatory protein